MKSLMNSTMKSIKYNIIKSKDSGRNWNNFNWQCLTGMS